MTPIDLQGMPKGIKFKAVYLIHQLANLQLASNKVKRAEESYRNEVSRALDRGAICQATQQTLNALETGYAVIDACEQCFDPSSLFIGFNNSKTEAEQ